MARARKKLVNQMYTIIELLDVRQIIYSMIGSILAAICIALLVSPLLWKVLKELWCKYGQITWLSKFMSIILFFIIFVLPIAGLVWFEQYTPGLKVSCEGMCTETDKRTIKRCIREANRYRHTMTRRFGRNLVALRDLDQCVTIEGFSTVRCRAKEPGCISFSWLRTPFTW